MHAKHCIFLLVIVLVAACARTPQVAAIPTLAALPSATLTAAATLPPTTTSSPTASWTPDILETQIAAGNLTNDAAQVTLAALWTQMVSSPTFTATPASTLTPSRTITNTITPTRSPEPVTVIQPVLVYARSLVNLRTCPYTNCPRVDQLHERDAVMATGMISGETVNGGSSLWYRVDRGGQQVYVYSGLVSNTLPTAVPTAQPPPQLIYVAGPGMGCDANSVSMWLDATYDATSAMFYSDPTAIQSAKAQFAAVPYPQCATNAYQYILQAFDEARLARQAANNSDFNGFSAHLNNESQLMDGFFSEADRLIDLAYTSSVSAYSGSGGGTGILCADGTISYAENRQGACSYHGGIADSGPVYIPPSGPVIDYPGTGYTVVCADGAISHSGGRRGACSHHGGVGGG